MMYTPKEAHAEMLRRLEGNLNAQLMADWMYRHAMIKYFTRDESQGEAVFTEEEVTRWVEIGLKDQDEAPLWFEEAQ